MVHPIAVISINRAKLSETFIQGAFDALPFHKTLLYGAYLPTHQTHDWRMEGRPIPTWRPPFWKRTDLSPTDQATANLRQWLRKHRPKALYCNYGPSGVATMHLARELKIPLIVHFHGYDAYRHDILSTHGQSYPQLFQTAHATIASSHHMREQLIHLGAPPHKVHTCIYGIHLHDFPQQPMPTGPFTFLFVGRFVPKKRPRFILEAMKIALDQGIDARLRMAGEGDLLAECREYATAAGLNDRVQFLGPLEQQAVVREIAAAHVLLVASATAPDGDSEGTPLIIMEAAATGRPVIATHHAGIPALFHQGLPGILIHTENELTDYSNAMLRLCQDREQRDDMASRAAKFAAEHLGHKNYLRMVADLIREAIAVPEIP